MATMKRSGPALILLSALAMLVFGVLAGSASTQKPAGGALARGGSDVIVACVQNATGQLRLVADASQCTKKEHAVQFQAATAPAPTSFTVDCAAGQSIGDVLAQVETGTAPVSIDVQGTCTESVAISRDHVTLNAATPGSGIAAPSADDEALFLDGARDVQLHGLTLTGGWDGLAVGAGATFGADGLHVIGAQNGVVLNGNSSGHLEQPTIENSSSGGVGMWMGGGTLTINGGTIANNGGFGVGCDSGEIDLSDVLVTANGASGVDAGGGCYVGIGGGVVQNSGGVGVWVGGGTVTVEFGTVIEGSGKSGAAAAAGGHLFLSDVVVRHNGESGVSGSGGGYIAIGSSTIADNDHDGVSLTTGSAAEIGSHTIIRDNSQNGLWLRDVSVAQLNSGNNEITGNGGWAVLCDPAPAVAMIHIGSGIGTVSGNGAGVSCPSSW